MTVRHILTLLAATLLSCLAQAGTQAVSMHQIQLVERQLFGPGPLPDQSLGAGHVHNMPFVRFMDATVPGANNGSAAPNVSGESLQGIEVDGRLSDGTLINENIDMGHVLLLQGRFNLLLAAVHGGPNGGNSHFYLDRALNWTIKDDIAIDPGFPEGIVKIRDFLFTTGPTFVPHSVQTQQHYPGGIDLVGSLKSGEVIAGRVGDDDLDGKLDGVFIALGNFPLDAILLPGAPFVQSIQFVSDVPLHALDAAMLSAAAARNRLRFIHQHSELSTAEKNTLVSGAQERLGFALRHVDRALTPSGGCGKQCQAARAIAQQMRALSIAADVEKAVQAIDALDGVVDALSRLHKARTGREVV